MNIKLKSILSLFIITLIIHSCDSKSGNDDEDIIKPEVSTQSVSSVTSNSALGKGSVEAMDNEIDAVGVCWSTSETPKRSDANNTTSFSSSFQVSLTNLLSSTTYYARAFVEYNDGEVVYGEQVSFKTNASDTKAPTISSITPSNSQTNVLTSTNIVITFSEAIKSSSVNSTNFKLKYNGSTVSSSISLNNNKVTINPSSNLKGGNASYSVSVSNVKDLANNTMSQSYNSTFKTKNTALTIQSHTPSSNATNIDITGDIVITMSANVLASSVTSSNLKLTKNGVTQAVTISVSGNKITMSPNENMTEFLTDYKVTMNDGIKDVNNNSTNISQTSFDFKTEVLNPAYAYAFKNDYNDKYMILNEAFTEFSLYRQYDRWGEFYPERFNVSNSTYAFENMYAYITGHTSKRITSTPANNGNPIIYHTRPSANGYYGEQIWQMKKVAGDNDYFYFYRISSNSYLNFETFDTEVLSSAPSHNKYKVSIERTRYR